MYESFYNFKAEPFRLSPDHRFCFSHKSYAKAKAYMQYAIHRAEGFVMVTGKPGTGKTTLVNDLVEGLSHSKIVVATIVSTQLEADDLLRLVACSFGLDIDAPNKAVVLQGLSVRLRRHHEEGTRALLIIDEAQDLSVSALEELRLLTNLQLNNQPLLQIFLVGQENLRDLVQKPSMEQVHQRLVAACHLESLNEEDTKAYIKHRLDRVGWNDDPSIDEGVYTVAYQFSKGIPRRINLVCSRFLLHGSVEEKHRIRASDVRTVVQELQHEQLTPIGFKAEMPPLNDQDDLDDETQSESVAAPREQKATESSINALAAEVVGGSSRDDQDVSLKDTSTAPIDNKHEITKKSEASETLDEKTNESLEALVNSENESASSSATLDSADVIQENYFSLGGSLDAPSEPVPIRP
ncbi:MAG: XrtA-associated ATPase, partial [Sedimenticola sp.]|nr:XrtA-associated ATPase [Sedimenticola sp.]